MGYGLVRWKNVLQSMYYYTLMRRLPVLAKRALLTLVRAQLGPDYDVATHFTPRYNPWDQRLCLTPDGDLFVAINAGNASVVTEVVGVDLREIGHDVSVRNHDPRRGAR